MQAARPEIEAEAGPLDRCHHITDSIFHVYRRAPAHVVADLLAGNSEALGVVVDAMARLFGTVEGLLTAAREAGPPQASPD